MLMILATGIRSLTTTQIRKEGLNFLDEKVNHGQKLPTLNRRWRTILGLGRMTEKLSEWPNRALHGHLRLDRYGYCDRNDVNSSRTLSRLLKYLRPLLGCSSKARMRVCGQEQYQLLLADGERLTLPNQPIELLLPDHASHAAARHDKLGREPELCICRLWRCCRILLSFSCVQVKRLAENDGLRASTYAQPISRSPNQQSILERKRQTPSD